MAWAVEYTSEFRLWVETLLPAEQARVLFKVRLLEEQGVTLGFPHSSQIHQSRHSGMRELRVQSGRSAIRVLYAFDPRRIGIVLIGGVKTNESRFYNEIVPLADRILDAHLENLRQEGLG